MSIIKKQSTKVFRQTEIATDIFDCWIETDLAQSAVPGQFISVYPQDKSTLLPRPISICQIDKEHNRLRMVYRVAGKGTTEISKYQAGSDICILGVLGNGFPIKEAEGKKVMIIAGGIGIPPMLEVSKAIQGEKDIILGYRDSKLFLKEEFETYGTVLIATEDGSVGTKGNVLNVITDQQIKADIIFACGPMPMLRAIKIYAEENGIKAYISLEERMACGVGACLACVCKTKEKNHHSQVNNTRICAEGPVFDAQEVDI